MTTYFNKKEEVINLELTQYGKYLLSKGKLRPVYYSFYDDDVLYDGAHGGVLENQNDIVTRIKDTPNLKVVYDFSSSVGFPAPYTKNSMGVVDANHGLSKPIGTIDSAKNFKPAWKVRKARTTAVNPTTSELSGAGSHQYLETYNRGQRIPQMEFTGSITYSEQPYGLIIEQEKAIVLNLEEVNGIFKPKGNFSVEVFEVVSGAISKQLYFIPEQNARAEGDFIKASEEELADRYPDLNKDFVEYYLDIRVDREIDEQDRSDAGIDIYTGDDGTGDVC
tara:strand:- start:137 stop:970 length:834 start_codon:yes stop_codon:yes gene_type:complete